MLKYLFIVLISCINILLNASNMTTVDNVDLMKYQGTWYEIAKIPNWFQKKCAKNVTATYKLREDGYLSVFNRCVEKSGDVNDIEGLARVKDTLTNAKLEVSFVKFLWNNWFWGDYWIIGLADDYSWVVVGTPEKKYGWILAREKQLNKTTQRHIFEILEEKGYDPRNFVFTLQE